ncbi:MAG: hypothetical protein OXF79_28645 [Chloroflexi bacterium]|nr:hypothetical protein [Chloroflexota bacterium]
MAQATAGLAGNEPIALYAGIGDHTQPQDLRLVPLDSLDGPALEQLLAPLLENPAFAEMLANFGTGDVKAQAPDEARPEEKLESPVSDMENTMVTDDVTNQDQPEANHGAQQNTQTATTGKNRQDGGASSRNRASKKANASQETAFSSPGTKATKKKETTKESNPPAKKSATKGKTKPQNVDIRCTEPPPTKDEQRNTTFPANDPEFPYSINLEFTPPSQASNPDWHCEKLGWYYNLLAQPASNGKRVPLPCMKCPGCIRYELSLKSLQYGEGAPAQLQTVMEFKARTANKARKFTGNRQHARRLPGARRVSFLDQKNLRNDEDGTRKSCQGVLIWDGPIPEQTRNQMEKHAHKNKMTHVKIYVMAVGDTKLQQLLPTRLRLPGQTINTCHFSAGWAKKRVLFSDWRDGLCRVVGIADGGDPVTEFWQPLRAQRVEESWEPRFAFEWDNDLTPEEREWERQWAMPYLHRARYVNFLDWFFSMSGRALEMTRACINGILNGGDPNLEALRKWTKAPKQMVLETAAFLMGERDPEPALTLAAERLGFISMLENTPDRHINSEFLAELTDKLPQLLKVTGPHVPLHLINRTSEPKNVYAQLNANYPKPTASNEPHRDAELAMVA